MLHGDRMLPSPMKSDQAHPRYSDARLNRARRFPLSCPGDGSSCGLLHPRGALQKRRARVVPAAVRLDAFILRTCETPE